MIYPNQHITVICEQCYQEFSLPSEQLWHHSTSHPLICQHCHEPVMMQATIGQKIMRHSVNVALMLNVLVVLSIIGSHLLYEIGLPPIIVLCCVLLHLLIAYAFKPHSVRLISVAKPTTFLH